MSPTNLEVDSSPELECKRKKRQIQDPEVEVFSFDQDDALVNSTGKGEDIVRQAVEQLDLNLTLDGDQQELDEQVLFTPTVARVQSPEIAIPGKWQNKT